MPKWLSRLWRRTSSASSSITLTAEGKKALLINQIRQLGGQIYLESVKREMVRRKALTDRKESRAFAELDIQLRGRVNAMKAEHEHLVAALRELDPSTVYDSGEDEE